MLPAQDRSTGITGSQRIPNFRGPVRNQELKGEKSVYNGINLSSGEFQDVTGSIANGTVISSGGLQRGYSGGVAHGGVVSALGDGLM